MIIYATTVFLSAFLLFLVQPILAKYILPWFGGSPGVWTTCLLFFQVLLTAGYGLSHLLANKLAPRRQAAAILALLLLTVAFLPITPSKAVVARKHFRSDMAYPQAARRQRRRMLLSAVLDFSPDAILVQPHPDRFFSLSSLHALESRLAACDCRATLLS